MSRKPRGVVMVTFVSLVYVERVGAEPREARYPAGERQCDAGGETRRARHPRRLSGSEYFTTLK